MINEINIREFIRTEDKIQGTGALFSHTTYKGTLNNYPGEWFCKEIKDPIDAWNERLAQELFRVIIPYQPRTLLARNNSNNVYYILSQAVPGYRNLPLGEAHNFHNGKYQGLGAAVITAAYAQETDLKNGNIGLDDQNRVIKIDGDRCFSQLLSLEMNENAQYKLTSDGIAALPRPVDFSANHWLNFIWAGQLLPLNDEIVDPTLSNSPRFRAEVNQSLYRICLLPDTFIEALVDANIPAGGQRYVNLLKTRRDQLQRSALSNPSFTDYLKTSQAQKDGDQFLTELKKFENHGEYIVKEKNLKKLDQDFKKNHNFPITITCNRLLDECGVLLHKLDGYRMVPNDPFMDEGIAFYKAKISQCTTDPKQLTEIIQRIRKTCTNVSGSREIVKKIAQYKLGPQDTLMDATITSLYEEINKTILEPEKIMEMKPMLTALLTSVSSKEIVAVKNVVAKMRNKAGFFSTGLDKKADNIENALLNTPLEERGTVLSSDKITAVQEAIATHRYLCSRGDVYKTKDGKIDPKRAPSLFNKLKAEHGSSSSQSAKLDDEPPTKIIL